VRQKKVTESASSTMLTRTYGIATIDNTVVHACR
jgi:hypothetical protein